MKCPYCNSELQEGAAFCLYCMKSLSEKQDVTPPKKKPSKASIVIASVAIASIIIAIIVAVACTGNESDMGPLSGTFPPAKRPDPVTSQPTADTKKEEVSTFHDTTEATLQEESHTDNTTTTLVKPQTEAPDTSENEPQIQTERETEAVLIPGSEPPVWEYVKIQGGIAVTGVYGENIREIAVPSQIDGKTVVAIEFDGDYYKDSWEGVRSLTVPDTVKYIGSYVFQNCELKSITLPDGLLYIGEHAFSGASIESITIPDTVTTIGPSAFYACEKLKDVKLSSELTVIPDSAFFMCYSLENVTIPESVTEIGGIAFKYCYTITTVTIEGSAVEIDPSAFDPEFRESDLTIIAPADLAEKLSEYSNEWEAEINSKK